MSGVAHVAQGQCKPLSDSEKLRGLWHFVTVKGNGTLNCDCYFSRERHQVCTHRATVYLHLKAHPQAPEKPQPPAPQRVPAPTTHEQASSAPAVSGMAQKAANALPADHTPTGFSIYADTPRERRYQTLEDEYTARDGAPSGDYYQHAYR